MYGRVCCSKAIAWLRLLSAGSRWPWFKLVVPSWIEKDQACNTQSSLHTMITMPYSLCKDQRGIKVLRALLTDLHEHLPLGSSLDRHVDDISPFPSLVLQLHQKIPVSADGHRSRRVHIRLGGWRRYTWPWSSNDSFLLTWSMIWACFDSVAKKAFVAAFLFRIRLFLSRMLSNTWLNWALRLLM